MKNKILLDIVKFILGALFGFLVIRAFHFISVKQAEARAKEQAQVTCLRAMYGELLVSNDNDFNDLQSSRASWNPTVKASRVLADEDKTLSACQDYLFPENE